MKKYSGIIKLIILCIIAPIIIWELGPGKTVNLYQKNQQLTKASPDSIVRAKTNHNPLTANSLLSNGTILQQFAEDLDTEEIKTINYTPEILASEGKYNLYLGTWTLTGRFISLVRLVAQIEKQQSFLRISSVHFETIATPKQKTGQLTMALSFINIEK